MISNTTAAPSRPSGNTMSIGCTGCPANLTLLSIGGSSVRRPRLQEQVAPGRRACPGATRGLAADLLLGLFQCCQVALHSLHRFLQVSLQLRLLYCRQHLILDLLNIALMELDLMLNESPVEFSPCLPLQLRRHCGTIAGADTPAGSRRQRDIELLRQGGHFLAVLAV